MKLATFTLLIAIILIGCEPGPNYDGWQWSGPGTVRSIDWYHRSFVFEADNQQIISYQICRSTSVPFWQGMRAEFSYRKQTDAVDQFFVCADIASVRRIN